MERKNNDDNEIEARNNSNNDNYEYLKEQFSDEMDELRKRIGEDKYNIQNKYFQESVESEDPICTDFEQYSGYDTSFLQYQMKLFLWKYLQDLKNSNDTEMKKDSSWITVLNLALAYKK